MKLTTRTFTVLALAAVLAPASAQGGFDRDDERDRIILTNGKELNGRVQQRHLEKEVLLRQGNKRVRVKKSKINQIETVRDHTRAFFKRRAGRDHAAAATHWEMSEWAAKRRLPHLAKVAAYATLARDPKHDKAHEFLGHRQRGNEWRWKLDSRYVSRETFDEYNSDMGHGLELRSEHFAIQTDAGLKRACDALYDLERLYLWWLDEHGASLELQELLEPINLKIFAEDSQFPPLSSSKLGYFVPFPHDDRCYVFYEKREERPSHMLTMASQALLYRVLANNADPGGPEERFCAWLEFGLSQWAESQFSGPAGQVEPGDVRVDQIVATLAASDERYSLKNMLHLHVRDHFYATSSARTIGAQRRYRTTRHDVHWAATQLFTTFLLDEKANPGLREKVWEYAKLALREGKGDSSSAFDKAIGQRVEKFEKPWATWISKRSKVPSRPK